MKRELLRQFFHRTREWSRAHRGAALFQLAVQSLTEIGEVDSGFFLYRRRMMSEGMQHLSQAEVYMPWGVFTGDEPHLSHLQADVTEALPLLHPFMERWMLEEDIPSTELREKWAAYNLLEFGVWPLVSREEVVGALIVARTTAASGKMTIETSHAILDSCAAHMAVALDLILAVRIAEHASQTDLLTGVYNRRGIESSWDEIVHRCNRSSERLVLCLVDVDEFKTINDTLGHPTGDEVLRKVAHALRTCISDGDVVGRLGGDEFICMYFTDESDVIAELNDLQHHVEGQCGYTISVGASVWGKDGRHFEELYEIADARLYQNKREFRKGIVPVRREGHR